MARLSFSAELLNDLSKVSNECYKEDLDKLYKCFREAHTRLFNEINAWLFTYDRVYPKLENNKDAFVVYKKARELYYKGSMIFDRVDLFDDYYKEYQSVVRLLRNYNEIIIGTRTLVSILNQKKEIMVKHLSSLYGLYSEAYKQLNEEEIYEG